MSPIGPSPTNTLDILLRQNPTIAGTGPHRHSGPVFGYVLEDEILFELEGDEPYPMKAGEAFWEPGFDAVHYQRPTCAPTSRANSWCSWSAHRTCR
jgi:hypothetical protein